MGFSGKIGIASSLMAELWAIRDGLMLCVDRNLVMVEIELDAKSVVDMLRNSNYTNNSLLPIIEDCRKLISMIPQIRINHCYQEANGSAEYLARKGTDQDQIFIVMDNPPEDMTAIVESDLFGVGVARRCPELLVVS